MENNQLVFEEIKEIDEINGIEKNYDKEEAKGRLEAIIFASGEAISVGELAVFMNLVPDSVETLLDEMENDYKEKRRGIRLLRLNSSVQLATKLEYSDSVKKLSKVNERQTLGQGALECLAIIAYRQPITRAEIDEIRGVSSEYVLSKLVERNIIKVAGRLDAPGKPRLYATTEEFLMEFGFNDLKAFRENKEYQKLRESIEIEQLNMIEEHEKSMLDEEEK